MQPLLGTHLVKILKWFPMAFKIYSRFPSLAHQDLYALALAGVFSFSFSLPPSGIITLEPRHLLVGPQVGHVLASLYPCARVLSFTYRANCHISLRLCSNTLSCQSLS